MVVLLYFDFGGHVDLGSGSKAGGNLLPEPRESGKRGWGTQRGRATLSAL